MYVIVTQTAVNVTRWSCSQLRLSAAEPGSTHFPQTERLKDPQVKVTLDKIIEIVDGLE